MEIGIIAALVGAFHWFIAVVGDIGLVAAFLGAIAWFSAMK
jgi:hypothetical protein